MKILFSVLMRFFGCFKLNLCISILLLKFFPQQKKKKTIILYYFQTEHGTKVEYRLWDPFQSKLAAAILDDVYDLGIVSVDIL